MIILLFIPFWLITVVPACLVAFIFGAISGGTPGRRASRGAWVAAIIVLALFAFHVIRAALENRSLVLFCGAVSVPVAAVGGALAGAISGCFHVRPYGSRPR